MPEPGPNPELMRSLGRLVRGLSALFWGLPLAFLVCIYSARAEAFRSFGIVPSLASTGLLVYGLWQLGSFQKQERVWRAALDRARVLGMANFFLSPFLYWWNRMPSERLFQIMVILAAFCALMFLASINVVLKRLGAMLPDEGLRIETRQFTGLNVNLLGAILVLSGVVVASRYIPVEQLARLPASLLPILAAMDRLGIWFLTLLLLLPLAMTMALLWKTKEVILENVFGAKP